ncbi:anti-repressor SinI family protein [Niallia oryzisoli]|uniref:Anti-repressor SinI family protein n=1 Tax=Niallia oryzisoli TaxID=1737571 RepID=A0ABZ2CHW6_9BACI
MVSLENGQVLDQEWLELIKEAQDLGLSIEEVRDFLLNG